MNRLIRRLALLGAFAVALSTSPVNLDWTAADQRAAREQLRLRGAAVIVFAGGGVLVHFPMGRHGREEGRQGMIPFRCGFGIVEFLTPDEHVAPVTDADLVHLDRIRGLARVNLSGTEVSAVALDAFRAGHRRVSLETAED
jgi:hypothetical protein